MIDFLKNTVALGSGLALGSQVGLRLGFHLQPHPMPHQMAATLDHPWRMKYRNPGATLGLFGILAGMQVLDLGCGTGTFTVEMARMVGSEGVVHAVEIQRPLLERARQRLTQAGLADRVRFHHSGAYRLPLPDASIDLAVLIATLPQIPDKARALAELRRVLKPDGRLAVSEELPDPAYVPPPVTRRWLQDGGFHPAGQSGSWFCYSLVAFPEPASLERTE